MDGRLHSAISKEGRPRYGKRGLAKHGVLLTVSMLHGNHCSQTTSNEISSKQLLKLCLYKAHRRGLSPRNWKLSRMAHTRECFKLFCMAELHQLLKSSEIDTPELQDTSGGASKNSSAKLCFGHLNMVTPALVDLHKHLSTSYVTILDASEKTFQT